MKHSLCIYGSHHIPTSQNARGCRTCRTQTGFFMGREEARRNHQESVALVNRRRRLAWLVEQWEEHLGRCRIVKESYL